MAALSPSMASSPIQPGALSLADLMAGFAESLPHAQAQLDRAWVDACDRYVSALPALSGAGLSLLRGLSPARHVVVEGEMRAALSVSREVSRQWRISVLNLAFERRFAHADFVRQTMTVKVVAHSWNEERLHGRADGADR
jgi:hypothetical protein